MQYINSTSIKCSVVPRQGSGFVFYGSQSSWSPFHRNIFHHLSWSMLSITHRFRARRNPSLCDPLALIHQHNRWLQWTVTNLWAHFCFQKWEKPTRTDKEKRCTENAWSTSKILFPIVALSYTSSLNFFFHNGSAGKIIYNTRTTWPWLFVNDCRSSASYLSFTHFISRERLNIKQECCKLWLGIKAIWKCYVQTNTEVKFFG